MSFCEHNSGRPCHFIQFDPPGSWKRCQFCDVEQRPPMEPDAIPAPRPCADCNLPAEVHDVEGSGACVSWRRWQWCSECSLRHHPRDICQGDQCRECKNHGPSLHKMDCSRGR